MTEPLGSSPLSSSHSTPPPPKVSGSTKGWAIAAVVVAAVATLAFPLLLLITLPISLLIIRKVRQINRDDPTVKNETVDTDRVARSSLSSSPFTESVTSLPDEIDDEEPPPVPHTSVLSSAAAAKPEVDPDRAALIERGKVLYRRGQEEAKRDLIKLIRELNELTEADIKGRENKQKLIESLALHTIKSETDPRHLESLGKLFASEEITNYTDLINRIQGSIADNKISQESLEILNLVFENSVLNIPERPNNNIANAFRNKLKDTIENLATLSSKIEFDVSDLIKFQKSYNPIASKLGLPTLQIDMATDYDAHLAKMEQERLDEELARQLQNRPYP